MAKILVIDGLARSGTTLLTSLLHSQPIANAYRGVFHEPLSATLGKWKKDYARHILISPMSTGISNDSRSRFEEGIKHVLDTRLLIGQTLESVHRLKQYDPINPEIWEGIQDRNISEWSDLDLLYQDIATVSNSEVLGFRWNQGLCWVDNFLRNKNHFWISVVRHPVSRALSDKVAFRESLYNGLKYAEAYGEILSSYQARRHKVIFFEDLVQDPFETCLQIFDFLETPVSTVNLELVDQSGNPYRVESSDLGRGKNRKEGRPFQGFEKSKAAFPQHTGIPRTLQMRFSKLMHTYSVYHRYGSL